MVDIESMRNAKKILDNAPKSLGFLGRMAWDSERVALLDVYAPTFTFPNQERTTFDALGEIFRKTKHDFSEYVSIDFDNKTNSIKMRLSRHELEALSKTAGKIIENATRPTAQEIMSAFAREAAQAEQVSIPTLNKLIKAVSSAEGTEIYRGLLPKLLGGGAVFTISDKGGKNGMTGEDVFELLEKRRGFFQYSHPKIKFERAHDPEKPGDYLIKIGLVTEDEINKFIIALQKERDDLLRRDTSNTPPPNAVQAEMERRAANAPELGETILLTHEAGSIPVRFAREGDDRSLQEVVSAIRKNINDVMSIYPDITPIREGGIEIKTVYDKREGCFHTQITVKTGDGKIPGHDIANLIQETATKLIVDNSDGVIAESTFHHANGRFTRVRQNGVEDMIVLNLASEVFSDIADMNTGSHEFREQVSSAKKVIEDAKGRSVQ